MGGGSYNAVQTRSLYASASLTGLSTSRHHDDIIAGRAKDIHESLAPAKRNGAGLLIRESLDSTDHPESRAIAIFLDVTGSMRHTPDVFKVKLPNLMELLTSKGIIPHPHMLIGAVGDIGDMAPLQIGQFEADDRINGNIQNIYKEGGGMGGGYPQPSESYQLPMWLMANHSKLDCFDKRNLKGYFFMVGDELPKSHVLPKDVLQVFNESISEPISTEQVVTALQAKYEVFWIRPGQTSCYNMNDVQEGIEALVGERCLRLDDPNSICECIALTIAINEGASLAEAKAMLAGTGSNPEALDAVEQTVIRVRRERV